MFDPRLARHKVESPNRVGQQRQQQIAGFHRDGLKNPSPASGEGAGVKVVFNAPIWPVRCSTFFPLPPGLQGAQKPLIKRHCGGFWQRSVQEPLLLQLLGIVERITLYRRAAGQRRR